MGTNSSERSLLSRRRALQIGAGAAFSAPTITSLAKTPAYAAGTSAIPITIDDFSLPQTGPSTSLFNGSFVSDERSLTATGQIMNDELMFQSGQIGAVEYLGRTLAPFNFADCNEIAFTNCATTGTMVFDISSAAGSVMGIPGGTPSGGVIIFELDGISPAILAAPDLLRFTNTGVHAPRSNGPLVAR